MKKITISPNLTIRQAMKALDKTAEKCLLVVDENRTLLGTLTDGDIRRSILSGLEFTSSIKDSYFKDPAILVDGKYSKDDAIQLLRDKKLDLIPIIDDMHRVIDFVTWASLGENDDDPVTSLFGTPVVIMAGGKGTRLEPLTKILPKPLVPIHDKPIIEHIIERFLSLGCKEFFLTVNHKSRIIKAYFEELDPAYKIHFVDETEPLGTAGSLRQMSGFLSKPFFVTNCDVIVKTDYSDLYEYHLKNGYDLTLVASAKDYIIPYGTCELDEDGCLSHINEKPAYEFLVNTGLYVLNPEVLRFIPKNKFYHITHLIEELKNAGKVIGVYPIDDDAWIDIGQWAEYRKALQMIEEN